MTTTDHTSYIANLKKLDAAWTGALRGAGFTRNGSRMVHKASGVYATRLGLEDGYLHRFDGLNLYADTVEQVEAIAAVLIEKTRG